MIWEELWQTYIMVLLGITVTFVYDILLIFREIIKSTRLLAIFSDIIYWIVAAVISFKVIYEINEGVLRGYVLVAMILSGIIFQRLIGAGLIRSALAVWKKLVLFIRVK